MGGSDGDRRTRGAGRRRRWGSVRAAGGRLLAGRCRCTATGCWGRRPTPRTCSRRRCSPHGEGLDGFEGRVLDQDVAVPDRDQPMPESVARALVGVPPRAVAGLRPTLPNRRGSARSPWLEPYPDVLLEGIARPRPVPRLATRATKPCRSPSSPRSSSSRPATSGARAARVLGFQATETARILETTTGSVTGALQRDRATLKKNLLTSWDRSRLPIPLRRLSSSGSSPQRSLPVISTESCSCSQRTCGWPCRPSRSSTRVATSPLRLFRCLQHRPGPSPDHDPSQRTTCVRGVCPRPPRQGVPCQRAHGRHPRGEPGLVARPLRQQQPGPVRPATDSAGASPTMITSNGTGGWSGSLATAPRHLAEGPVAITVENLVREFSPGTRAVDGISLHVSPGEIYGFLGPNGAGKSTTVLMLTTLLPATSGRASVRRVRHHQPRPPGPRSYRRRPPGGFARRHADRPRAPPASRPPCAASVRPPRPSGPGSSSTGSG